MSDDVKPCPICKGTRGKALLEELAPGEKYDWRIRCYGCSLEMTPRISTRGPAAKQEILTLWNNRDD